MSAKAAALRLAEEIGHPTLTEREIESASVLADIVSALGEVRREVLQRSVWGWDFFYVLRWKPLSKAPKKREPGVWGWWRTALPVTAPLLADSLAHIAEQPFHDARAGLRILTQTFLSQYAESEYREAGL